MSTWRHASGKISLGVRHPVMCIVLDDSLKVLVGSVFGVNGTLTLAVGQSVTRPVDAAVPLIEYRDSRWARCASR
jgi:hypothetical protein